MEALYKNTTRKISTERITTSWKQLMHHHKLFNSDFQLAGSKYFVFSL